MSTNNPFIEILPPLYDLEEFVSKINYYPNIQPGKREIESQVSLDDLYDYYETQIRSYDYYVQLVRILYGGYKRRTPRDLIDLINKSRELTPGIIVSKVQDHVSLLNPSTNLLFIGYPGVGKTLINNRIRSLFPLRYVHNNLGIIQVPILKIECPTRASTLQLCRNFFSTLDKSVGSNYAHQFRKTSEPELMRQMLNKASLHFIGVLLVDEVQNLKIGTPTEIATTLNFLKFLTNEFKVPVVFIGTPQAEDLFIKDLQNNSRVQTIRWNRIMKDSEDWDPMIEGLWKQQIFNSGELTQMLKDAYFRYSQGIYRILITLHITAQRIALTNQWNRITPEVLETASKEEMFLLEVMILALENKQTKIIELFDDMREDSKFSKGFNGTFTQSKPKKTRSEELLELGLYVYKSVDKNTLKELIAEVQKELPDKELRDQATRLKQLVDNLQSTKSETKGKKLLPKGKLLDITQNAETSLDSYNLLKEAGIIRPVLDLITI